MALFRVRALGFPEIRRDDGLCQLALRKGFALLIYLAEAKGAVGRDAVATMLWPESSEDVVRARGGLEPRSTKPGGQRSRLDHQVTGDLLPADGDTASEVTNFVCTWRLCCTRACTFAMMRLALALYPPAPPLCSAGQRLFAELAPTWLASDPTCAPIACALTFNSFRVRRCLCWIRSTTSISKKVRSTRPALRISTEHSRTSWSRDPRTSAFFFTAASCRARTLLKRRTTL